MGSRSLTDTARSVLMKESNDPTPDRDAKKSNPNMDTLHPGSKAMEPVHPNPGAIPPDSDEVEDLGPALVEPTGESGPAKSHKKMRKDTSKSSRSSVPAEPMHSLGEDVEISEELAAFITELEEKGLSEDEIAQAIEENFEIVEDDNSDSLYEDMEISEELAAFITNLEEQGLSEDEIARAIEENFEIVEEKEDDEDDKGKKSFSVEKESLKEHVDALFAGETLSEAFKKKAETILESAINERLVEITNTLEEAYAEALEEQVKVLEESLKDEVNDYLNYVVENWVSENEVDIETGLRSELTEDFISGLRNLFAEHYIDIPEDKVNIVDELGNQVTELENKLNEQIEKNVELLKVLNESHKSDTLAKACDDLTDVQSAKLKALVENVQYTDEKEFAQKVNILKENYFPSSPAKNSQALDQADSSEGGLILEGEETPVMDRYLKALGKK